MKDKVFFSEKEKLVPDDMNGIHNETEAAFADLIRSISGGYDTLLFVEDAPSVVESPPNLRIDVPEQWFSVDGIPEKIIAQSVLKPLVDNYHKLFFVIQRTDLSDDRDFFQIVGSSIQIVTQSTTVRKQTTPRIEVTSSGNPSVPPGPPTLGTNDIGYIEYASVIKDGATITVSLNTAAVYSFPGAGLGFTNHAGTHLPSGSDPIQLAALGGPSGSVPGLMPEGSYAVLSSAIQDLYISPSSPFLTRTISGDNSPGDPKRVELRVRYDGSLKSAESGGVDYLGLNYPTGPRSGISERPARSDHWHSPSESPVAIEIYRVSVSASDLGTLVDVPEFRNIARIYQTQVFWAPPGYTSPPYPQVECGWKHGSDGIGVRAHLVTGNTVKLEIGSFALTEILDPLYSFILTEVGGSPIWTHVTSPSYPTDGELYLKVIGLR
jgi:hypothetical protein